VFAAFLHQDNGEVIYIPIPEIALLPLWICSVYPEDLYPKQITVPFLLSHITFPKLVKDYQVHDSFMMELNQAEKNNKKT
jgi:hypothetical protein